MKSFLRHKGFFVIIPGLFLAAGMAIGFFAPAVAGYEDLRQERAKLSRDEGNGLSLVDDRSVFDNFELFWRVWEIAQTRHLDGPLSSNQLLSGAINGILRFGYKDAYSIFLPLSKSAYDIDAIASAGDVGFELDSSSDGLRVTGFVAGSSLDNSSIRIGDTLISIDGQSCAGLSVVDAMQRLMGNIGEEVVLGYLHRSGDMVEYQEITVKRQAYNRQSMDWRMLDEGYFVIEAKRFASTTPTQWHNATEAILALAPRGLILDLRGNTGGSIEGVQDMVSSFVSDRMIYQTVDRYGQVGEHQTDSDGIFQNLDLVVLVNSSTASAAEMVAGALKFYDRATIIGVNSYGKDVILRSIRFDDGTSTPSVLQLAVMRWSLPDGSSVGSTGIAPDITITESMLREDPDAYITRALQELKNLYRMRTQQ